MNWFLLSIPSGFGISLIIIEWTYMAEILPIGILSTTGGVILFITLFIGYCQYFRANNDKLYTKLYVFYKSVKDYIEWYDSGHELRFIKEQKQALDELEKYIEINNKKFTSKTIKRTNYFKDKLNEIVSILWSNAQHSNQTKRYEVWKNIKFNIIENEIKLLYEQLKKNLAVK